MRSLAGLLLISTIAYLAYSQSSCGTAPTGCSLCAQTTAGVAANTCTSCLSQFLLAAQTGACTACTVSGCASCSNATTCTSCMLGYGQLNTSGVITCVTLNTTTTGCWQGVAINATTINCTACGTGYAWLSTGYCVSCSTTTAQTLGAGTWYGEANCATCTNVATLTGWSTTKTAATPVGNIVTCTSCASGYFLILAVNTVATTTTGIVTPFCVAAAATGTTIGALSGFQTSSSTAPYDGNDATCITSNITAAVATMTTNCLAATVTSTPTSNINVAFAITTCTMPAATYFFSGTTGSTTVPSTASTGCTAGYTLSSVFYCTTCTNTTTAFYSLQAGVCVVSQAGCLVQLNASLTSCVSWASGYAVLSNGTAFNTATSYVLSTGALTTGTGLSGCLIHNSTSFCLTCGAGYVSAASSCTACPSGCNVCSSATVCTTCAPTYTSSTNGTCVKQNCTNVTANGTCAYSKNMIASGFAFVSMIFYYIF